MPPDLKIFTAAESIDLPWLLKALHDAGLVPHYTIHTLMRATERSLCFSAVIEKQQVGFARVITDGTTVSLINDVVVDAQWRRQGIGTALMAAVMAHRQVKDTICVLHTRTAHFFYEQLGFVPVGGSFKRDPQ